MDCRALNANARLAADDQLVGFEQHLRVGVARLAGLVGDPRAALRFKVPWAAPIGPTTVGVGCCRSAFPGHEDTRRSWRCDP